MNSYANLAVIKDSLRPSAPSGTDYDASLLRISEEVSRMEDKYTERFFYIYSGTMYQDGGSIRVAMDWDIQSVSTLFLDTDGDGTYETSTNLTVAPVDAYFYPQNITPKTRIEANPWGAIGHFAAGIRNGIKITGVFGYGNDWPDSYYHAGASLTNLDLTSTAATVTVTSSTCGEFSIGMTLTISSEQMYIDAQPTGSSSQILHIRRAVNGTTAGTPTSGATIYIYDYPSPIVQACIIQTVRQWKRRESAYQTMISNPITGQTDVYKGLDPDVKEIINKYKRIRQPRYIGG